MTFPHHRASPSKSPLIRPEQRWMGSGYSFVEIVWVIALLGVFAGIAISKMSGMSNSALIAVGVEKMERLNQAVTAYGVVVPDAARYYPGSRSDTGDEQAMLLTLEYRSDSILGSPFIDPRYRPDTSSDVSTVRIAWTGSLFKLYRPGEAGAGLLVPPDDSDMKTPFAYPPNFRPLGR